jgi:glycosyltransferase involved in cell wall biosynthesis
MGHANYDIHVLQVVNTLGVGGVENYVVRLSNAIQDSGMRVTLAASSNASQLSNQMNPAVEYLELPLRPASGLRLLRPLEIGTKVQSTIYRYIKGESVHLVHTHQPATGLGAWLAASHAGIPVVHRLTHVYENSDWKERLMYRTSALNSMVSVFYGLSGFLSDELRNQFGVPDDRVMTITSGIDTTLFAPADQYAARRSAGIPEDRFVVGTCARLHPVKRLDLAIRAHAVLTNTVPNALLVIAGSGPEESSLVSLAELLGISGMVMFLGEVEHVNRLLPAFDVYLQTTKGPALGWSVLEALACGKPVVIAADSDREMAMGKDTLCGAECGIVVAASPRLLAEAIDRIARDPDLLLQMSLVARQVALSRYEWKRHVSQTIELYRSLVCL